MFRPTWRLALLLAVALPGPALSQATPTPIGPHPTCDSCTVELEHLLRLGCSDPEHEGFLAATDVIAQVASGDFILSQQFDNGRLYVFGDDGRFKGTVGREGEGPGEFGMVMEITALDNGGFVAFDRPQVRASAFDEAGELVHTFRMSGIAPLPGGAEFLPGDSILVLSGHARTAARAGYPLHFMDLEGRIRSSFGAVADAAVGLGDRSMVRRLAVDPRGSIWSVSQHDYTIREWSLDGTLRRAFKPDLPGYVPFDPGVKLTPETGRYSEVMDVTFDASRRLLFVIVQMPSLDEDWTDGLVSEEYGGVREYGPRDLNRMYDTLIQVFAVDEGLLMMSARVNPALRRFVGVGYATSHVVSDPRGIEHVDVWRVGVR